MGKPGKNGSRVPSKDPDVREARYWIGVVSLSHVKLGRAGGYAQLGHGKAAPLRRMSKGDWLVSYSPKTDMTDGEPLQMFTAIGKIRDDRIYEHAMGPDFVPFRRDLAYLACRPASIQPLLAKLSFIKDPERWGYPFRTGHFEIGKADFLLIAEAMGVRPDA